MCPKGNFPSIKEYTLADVADIRRTGGRVLSYARVSWCTTKQHYGEDGNISTHSFIEIPEVVKPKIKITNAYYYCDAIPCKELLINTSQKCTLILLSL